MWLRLALLLCLIASIASAASVQWDASVIDAEHGAPDGYRVYYGSASDQLTTVWDNGGSTVFDIPDVWAVGTYYFGVRAYNASGESGWATTPEGQTWVSYVKAEPPPVLPPAPATDVRIVWEQKQMAFTLRDSGTYYGTDSISLSVQAGDLIIAVGCSNSSLATLTFSGGGTWVHSDGGGSDSRYWRFGHVLSTTGSGSTSFSVTNASGDFAWYVFAFSWSGGSLTGTQGQTLTSTTVFDSGDGISHQAGALLLGGWHDYLSSGFTSWNNGFSTIEEQTSHWSKTAYVVAASAGTTDCSGTIGTLVTARSAFLIVFEETGGGSSAVPVIMRSYRARRN